MHFTLVVFAICRDHLEENIVEIFSMGDVTIIQVNIWHLVLDIILMLQIFYHQV